MNALWRENPLPNGNLGHPREVHTPAVVFNGTLFPPSLRAFDAATGTPLQSFTFPGSVNSSPAIVGGLLVVGSGNSFNGSGSAVNAYKLP